MIGNHHFDAQPAVTLMVSDGQGNYRTADKEEILRSAQQILFTSLTEKGLMDDALAVGKYLQAWIGTLEHEVFAVLFLDCKHRLIEREIMFRGTISKTAVYPREIVKRCLEFNAAAVIFAHNHPSGCFQPSREDEALTQTLKCALNLVDVRCLDHIIVSPKGSYSMAQNGLM